MNALTDEPIDYWRAVVRRGVLCLGFCVQHTVQGPILVADLSEPLDGWSRRAAVAAIAIHNLTAGSIDPPIAAARTVLAMALDKSAASAPLADYQALLCAAVWSAVEDDPPRRIEALSQTQAA
ncbi:hypothetical protein [Caulobacter sp. RHG1]|uniref:hypothetical protein n=1 Tax=Caulobacter sp. (strain RHG1) TaxID=2545762 RepID=UPI001553C7B3|nr:hypothetical protein [Caulobacter sp. RHG1]NQE61453.1 hypothetical protein [Caulobacter sp. RHG1]